MRSSCSLLSPLDLGAFVSITQTQALFPFLLFCFDCSPLLSVVAAALGSMASEASVTDQTNDGLVGEKKMIDDVKNIEEMSNSQLKGIGGDDEIEKLKVEESSSSETAIIEPEEKADKKDDTTVVEKVKKEEKDDKVFASDVSEDQKDDAPLVEEVKKEEEDDKASGSEVLEDKREDAPAVEDVEREVENDKISSSEEPADKADKKSPEEQSICIPELSSEVVEKPVEESEVSSIQEPEQVGKGSEVSESVTKTEVSPEEPADISADPASASERVTVSEKQPIVPAVREIASDVTGEVGKKIGTPEANESAEISKDEKIFTDEAETSPELLKDDPAVKETANLNADSDKLEDGTNKVHETSASQNLDIVVADSAEGNDVSEITEKADADRSAGGHLEETKKQESGSNTVEGLVKKVAVDGSMPDVSAAIGAIEAIDTVSVTEVAESIVKKPEVKVEEENQEKTVETDEPTPTDTNTVEDLRGSNSAIEVTEISSEKVKPSEDDEKVVEVLEEQDLSGSNSATEVTEIPSEKGNVSDIVEKIVVEQKDDMTTFIETSRDLEPEGRTSETDTSVKEPVDKFDEAELEMKQENSLQSTADQLEKDEMEEKKDETGNTDAQNLIESSNDGGDLKPDEEIGKAEVPAKPSQRHSNNLISKVKHSIVKVKKAIIGKSPSSKTISLDAKDELKVK